MHVLTAALFLAIGVVLGMLGGGGAILTLPMLVYAADVPARPAIAMSLFVVGATAVVGAAFHARASAVEWRIGSVFGAAAMTGAFFGGRLARFVPAEALILAFAVVMLLTAIAMLRGRTPSKEEPKIALARALGLGGAVGVVSGLVGAGGGFLIVPALTIFGGLAMRHAVGTSLFVIALQSFAGFAGQITGVTLDWMLVAIVTSSAVAGSVLGTFLAGKIHANGLRRGFGWLVLAMGLFVIAKQSSIAVTVVAATFTSIAVLVVLTRGRARFTTREKPCTISPLSPHSLEARSSD